MRLHSCRHYAADRILAGASLYHVQVALGHSDPRVSQRYAKLKIEDLRTAMESASLFQSKPQPPATPPPPAEVVLTQPEAGAIPTVTPTAEVLQFPKAA